MKDKTMMLTYESCYGAHPPECQTKSIERYKHRKEGWVRGQLAMRERVIDILVSQEWETIAGSAVIKGLIQQIQRMEPA
jgi:hypothetical protein